MAAWRRRDAGFDGLFVFGVRTTGIFCRPSCPSRPHPEHLEFFRTAGLAMQAGYRPCKRCSPELAHGRAPSWVERLMREAQNAPDRRMTAADLRALNTTPERTRRWFQKHRGMTFATWCRRLRLAHAFSEIRDGAPLDDVILGHGFESHSGFRAAFAKVFGQSPRRAVTGGCLRAELLESPLGPMLAVTDDDAVCQLEFADCRELETSCADLRKRFDLPILPGSNAVMAQLRTELQEYFHKRRRSFGVRVRLAGTSFQERVWRTLRELPYGITASYEEIARRIGSATAVRAVARANATNRIYILVPCHRVVAKGGALSGYGGGVWRKRHLLQLEQARAAADLHPSGG